MDNKYIYFDDHAEIVVYSEKYGTFYVKIDLEDVEKCQDYKWSVGAYRYKKEGKVFHYATNKKVGLLHRFVTNAPKNIQVDHKNRDTVDNRKDNLREATRSQQGMNGNIPVNNTSGHLGVTWVKSLGKWMASLGKNMKKINLGYYDDIDDAIRARKEGEIKHFGEYKPSD
jgi:hypothetical protein